MRNLSNAVTNFDNNWLGPVLLGLFYFSLGVCLGFAFTGIKEVGIILGAVGIWASQNSDSNVYAQFISKVYLTSGIPLIIVARADMNDINALRELIPLYVAGVGFFAGVVHFFLPILKN